MTEQKPILQIEDLNVTFSNGKKNKLVAVNQISLEIQRGENFGLVGESGCGKTTLGRTLVRLYNPTSGTVSFDGNVISGRMNRKLRKYISENIAMIFQDPVASLNPRMTIHDIIAEGLRAGGEHNSHAITAQVHALMGQVGLLPEHATRYPHEFSGGQRQRIGIARALALRPPFIIADEPVSALDVSIQAQVINLLIDLKHESNLTVMFIAHDLSVVKYFSDRIGVMYAGRLVELADADELYQNPVHPYTRALLSAIPRADPIGERQRVRSYYDPSVHDYAHEPASLQLISPRHYVYASAPELDQYKKQLGI